MTCQWQQQGKELWVFGESVRGLVRKLLAVVGWQPGNGAYDNWFWKVILPEGKELFGRAVSLLDGVQCAENRLKEAGLLEEDVPRGTQE